jgi:hypothetical protein
MNVSRFILPLKWIVSLTFVSALLIGAYLVQRHIASQRAAEANEQVKPSRTVASGRIKFGEERAKQLLKLAEAKETEWVPRVPVYGRVVSNPSATSEVRAAFAGRLRNAGSSTWPNLAGHVKAGELLGQLEVRGPQDRLDLMAKLREAEQKLNGAKEIVKIQQEKVNRYSNVSVNRSLAQAEKDAADIALAEAQTQFDTSASLVQLYQNALDALDKGADLKHITWTVPLTAPADGEITDLIGRPDMLVEAGALVAKVVDFRKVLVRVDLPLNLMTAPPKTLELHVLPATPPAFEGPTNRPQPTAVAAGVPAELVGAAGQVDPTLQAVGYLYRVEDNGKAKGADPSTNLWRPGLFTKAHLQVNAAKPISALAVPKSALLYHQGRALVYRQTTSRGTFQRVEVEVLGHEGDNWVVNVSPELLADGDLVVVEGAVLLLSEEFRADVDD